MQLHRSYQVYKGDPSASLKVAKGQIKVNIWYFDVENISVKIQNNVGIPNELLCSQGSSTSNYLESSKRSDNVIGIHKVLADPAHPTRQ